MSYIVVLCGLCLREGDNEEDDKSECLDWVVSFKNEKQYETYNEDSFDSLLPTFNKIIQKKYGKDWTLDDVVEVSRIGTKNDKVDMDLSDL